MWSKLFSQNSNVSTLMTLTKLWRDDYICYSAIHAINLLQYNYTHTDEGSAYEYTRYITLYLFYVLCISIGIASCNFRAKLNSRLGAICVLKLKHEIHAFGQQQHKTKIVDYTNIFCGSNTYPCVLTLIFSLYNVTFMIIKS